MVARAADVSRIFDQSYFRTVFLAFALFTLPPMFPTDVKIKISVLMLDG